MTALRIIDLDPFYAGGPAGRWHVAGELDAACRELGFFAVTGHRIDPGLIARTRAAVRGFFALPAEAKLAARPAAEATGRGYVPVEGETLSSTTSFKAAPDYKESFSIGVLEPGDEPYYLFEPSGVAFAPNVWPPEPLSFQPAMRQCYQALGALADDLLTLTALALGLAQNWFAPVSDRPTSALRVLHHPPRPHLGEDQYPAARGGVPRPRRRRRTARTCPPVRRGVRRTPLSRRHGRRVRLRQVPVQHCGDAGQRSRSWSLTSLRRGSSWTAIRVTTTRSRFSSPSARRESTCSGSPPSLAIRRSTRPPETLGPSVRSPAPRPVPVLAGCDRPLVRRLRYLHHRDDRG
jgi:hypothetical protein